MRFSIFIILVLLTACDNRPNNIALGTLERERISHAATINEVVVALPVSQGSVVTKGTLLVQLDNTYQLGQVSKAEAEVGLAEANLKKLRNGARKEEVASARAKVAESRAALVESEARYNRSLNLNKQKLISDAELDRDLASYDISRASLKNSQGELHKLTNGTREEDLHMAEASLAAAMATITSERKKLSDLSITATRDGILDSLPWNLGERVTAGSPLAIVLAGIAPFARVYVPEPYRVKLQVGDKLLVRVDGVEKPIMGQLRWISSEAAFTPYYALNQEERTRLMYLAEVQLPESEAQLPNGVPAQVELP